MSHSSSLSTLALVLLVFGLAGCTPPAADSDAAAGTATTTDAPAPMNDAQKGSYVIGHQVGTDVRRRYGETTDADAMIQGISDALAERESAVPAADLSAVMQRFQELSSEHRNVASQATIAAGKAFLEQNGMRDGVVTTDSGLQYEVLVEGNPEGQNPSATDTVVTHYHGTLIDGTVFDSSVARGQPAKFPLNGVIKGWTEALQLMRPGDKYKLFLPPELAYGERGAGEAIGPNATLIFEVELIEVEDG